MPGLPKSTIAARIQSALAASGASIVASLFAGADGGLPFDCQIEFREGIRREYVMYFWTISHGGNGRAHTEYRIQAKLKSARSLTFDKGTTLLMGYYLGAADDRGTEQGNVAAPEMEAFAAWDPLLHLRVGASSSCQIPFSTLEAAYSRGVSATERRSRAGHTERVIAFRPDYLTRYLRAAAGGHNSVDMATVAGW